MEAKEANLLAACKSAGHKCSNAEDKLERAARAQEKVLEVPKLWPLTGDAQIGALYAKADREFDPEAKWAIHEIIIKAVDDNRHHHEAVSERGKYALKARNEAWTELLKTGSACVTRFAQELDSHLRGRLPLYQHDPSLAPDRVAEILVMAERLERAGVRPGLLQVLPADIARVVALKRKSTTVAA